MGRKKIQISRIGDERNRQVTFTKRKFGLMKKAYELSVLCDCEIALIIFNSANKLFQYASTDMDKVLLKYTEYNEPHESRTNKDIIESIDWPQALNKKEHKGCESPEPDHEQYMLGPRSEEKYGRINEEYARVMQQNSIRASMQQYPNVSMPVSVPLHNPGYMVQSPITSSLAQNSSISSTTGLLQPHGVGPSVSPRPNSTGGMVDLSTSAANSYQQRSSPSTSPGVLSNKVMTKQSPNSQQRQTHNLRVMIPNCRGDMMNSESQPRNTNVLGTSIGSMTNPGMPGSSYPSALPNSFQPNNHNQMYVDRTQGSPDYDFALNTDLSGMTNYNHWGSQGPQPPPGSLQSNMHINTGSGSMTNNNSALALNILNPGLTMHIKSEPISPPRESNTPSSQQLRPTSVNNQGHISPGHISHSNSSSPSSTQEYEQGPTGSKRSRIDGWAT
ncbi:myocyte-specific enhancer factor 2C isoform X3 [Octopus sinensis]|uniref:Myocyte-specific enhancer factor 2C isoform X3 n=1 Tax=Octopus sinensis TaxID=2607531 RepID=A0A6P7SC49_9MOLL|nr:myocyte-specific enhancer factor 2C isoform X3 [Octopus sinensis]